MVCLVCCPPIGLSALPVLQAVGLAVRVSSLSTLPVLQAVGLSVLPAAGDGRLTWAAKVAVRPSKRPPTMMSRSPGCSSVVSGSYSAVSAVKVPRARW